MRKNRKYIIIAAVLLVLLIGAYFIISMAGNNEEPPAEDGKGENSEVLFSLDMSDIDTVNITVNDTIVMKSSGFGSVRTVGYDLTLDEGKLIYAFANAAAPSYVRKIEDVSDLSQYGLDDPTAQVRINMSDGGVYSYILGNKTVSDGYYLMLSGDDAVYITDQYMKHVAECTAENNAKLELCGAVSSVLSVTLESDSLGGRVVIEKNNGDTVQGSLMYQEYKLSYPDTGMSLSEYYMDESVLAFKKEGMTLERMEKAHPDSLAEYGLDKPYGTFAFTYEDGTHTVTAAKPGNDGMAYCTVDSADAVYVIDFTKYLSALDLTVMSLCEQYLFIDRLDMFSSIRLVGDGFDDTYAISGTLAGEDEPLTVTSKGKEVNTDEFKRLYSGIISVAVKGEAQDTDRLGAKLLEIDMTYRSGETRSVVYYYVSASKAAVRLDNKDAFYYVYTKDLDTLIDSIENFKKVSQ